MDKEHEEKTSLTDKELDCVTGGRIYASVPGGSLVASMVWGPGQGLMVWSNGSTHGCIVST
jgi:bacteriocin-like protein